MARAPLLRWAEACVVLSFLAHVVVVPGVKVEESFSLTAVRDVVVHGLDQPHRARPVQLGLLVQHAGTDSAHPQYDHVEFEGAVPRSFVAPIALAAAASLPLKALSALELVRTGFEAQLIGASRSSLRRFSWGAS